MPVTGPGNCTDVCYTARTALPHNCGGLSTAHSTCSSSCEWQLQPDAGLTPCICVCIAAGCNSPVADGCMCHTSQPTSQCTAELSSACALDCTMHCSKQHTQVTVGSCKRAAAHDGWHCTHALGCCSAEHKPLHAEAEAYCAHNDHHAHATTHLRATHAMDECLIVCAAQLAGRQNCKLSPPAAANHSTTTHTSTYAIAHTSTTMYGHVHARQGGCMHNLTPALAGALDKSHNTATAPVKRAHRQTAPTPRSNKTTQRLVIRVSQHTPN